MAMFASNRPLVPVQQPKTGLPFTPPVMRPVGQPASPYPQLPNFQLPITPNNTYAAPKVNPLPANFDAKSLFDSYNKNYAAANTANEQRYGDILKGYDSMIGGSQKAGAENAALVAGGFDDRYKRGMQNLEGMGLQEASDIRQTYNDRQGSTTARLSSLGLGGTTIAPTMAMGIDKAQVADQGRLQERIRQQRLTTDAMLSGDSLAAKERLGNYQQATNVGLAQNKLNFQERREDTLPDMGLYAQLAQQIGAGGGAPGGAGGGYGGGGGGGSYSAPPPAQIAGKDYVTQVLNQANPGWGGGVVKIQKKRPLTDAEKAKIARGEKIDSTQYSDFRGGYDSYADF